MAALREGDHEDVSVERLELGVDATAVPAIHARPDGMPVAGVVVHPDVGGLRPLFDDLCRRLATHGFAVCAVEPFARIPAEERSQLDAPARLERMHELDDDVQLGDLEAAADHLVVHDDVDRLAVIGFCMGGHFVLKAAARDRFHAAVPFYGMVTVPESWQGPGLRSPLDTADEVCPTLAIFGGADPWTPSEEIEELRRRWAGRDDCEIVVVDGADHGFVHDPDRPAHRPDDAAAMWERALAWIRGA